MWGAILSTILLILTIIRSHKRKSNIIISKGEKDMKSVPIMIDSVKNIKGFQMTRCTYFSIESDTPSLDWILQIGDQIIPFMLIGLSGIITKPIGADPYFNSIQLIEDLFDAIEKKPNLYVDINSIWLPNFLFESDLRVRGQVYRAKEKLFIAAYQYQVGEISLKELMRMIESDKNGLKLSETETGTFKKWAKIQIEEAKKAYPKSTELELDWIGKYDLDNK
jgi:hypothetical protein